MLLVELIPQYPRTAVIIIGALVSFLTVLLTKYVTDQNRMRELKKMQKDHQEKIKQHKDDPQKMMELNKEFFSVSMEMLRHGMKPALFTMIPALILIFWMKEEFATTIIASSWIWWYIGAAILSSIVFRKVLKVV